MNARVRPQCESPGPRSEGGPVGAHVREHGGAQGRALGNAGGASGGAQVDVSFDRSRLDIDRVHGWLSGESYWSRGIPRATVERAIAGSLCAGAYAGPPAPAPAQVGFARVVSDGATFAYLCDVFVDPAWRGRGIGGRLMRAVFAHPSLQGLRRFALVTRDAHGLYAQHGFTALADPRRWMERTDPDIYLRGTAAEGQR